MIYATAGEASTFLVPFLVDGEFVTPDDGSVTYTVRGNDGAALSGLSAVAVSVSTTEVPITVSALANAKDAGKDFENRFIIVDFEADGYPHQAKLVYTLVDWMIFTTSGDDVRALIGASSSELPDQDIDLVSAYFKVRSTLGSSVLTEALSAGNATTRSANRAIACTAALEALPSLQLRVPQSDGDGMVKFTRFSGVDWRQLTGEISAKLATALSEITGVSESTPVFGVVATSTDVITG